MIRSAIILLQFVFKLPFALQVLLIDALWLPPLTQSEIKFQISVIFSISLLRYWLF